MIVYPSFSKLSCPVLAARGGRWSDPSWVDCVWTEADPGTSACLFILSVRAKGVRASQERRCLCCFLVGTLEDVRVLAARDAADPFIVAAVVQQEPCDSNVGKMKRRSVPQGPNVRGRHAVERNRTPRVKVLMLAPLGRRSRGNRGFVRRSVRLTMLPNVIRYPSSPPEFAFV